LFKLVASNSVSSFAEKYGFDYSTWNNPEFQKEIDGRSLSLIKKLLDEFNAVIDSDPDHEDKYKQLFFAELFLHYAESRKGDTALNILTDEQLSSKLIVPQYIEEGFIMAIEITSDHIFTNQQLSKHAKIYAGPGAGKTHFLVENVKNIVTTHPLLVQSSKRKVLCITYTNAAVDEIVRRLDRYSDLVEIYTIHGFIIEHIIKPFQQELRQIIYDDFGIIVSEKGKITSQVEGLSILHGVDKDALFKYIIDITSESDKPNYSKKVMGDISIDINMYNNDPSSFAKKDASQKFKVSSRIQKQHIIPIKNICGLL
jgi:hypothetical protein